MVRGERSLAYSGRVRSPGGAEREPIGWAAEPVRAVGSFLTGDQSGHRGQDRVEVLASAEVSRQGTGIHFCNVFFHWLQAW